MKLKYINGLKGICCVLVSMGHMVAILLPSLYFGPSHQSHTGFATAIYETPLNMLFNSSSALMCFLLLSGFVIPIKTFCGDEKISVLGKWWDKYFRLMPMAFIGVLFSWIIMRLGLVYSYRITDLSYSYTYAVSYNNFVPAGLFEKNGPIFEGIIRVFLLNSQMNNPLNTLKYIWQYSFILLVFTKWITRWKYRDFIYGGTVLASFFVGQFYRYDAYYLGAMVLGMWICDGIYNPARTKHLNELTKEKAITILLFGIVFLSIPVGNPIEGIYKWVGSVPINHTLYWIIGWSLCLIAVSNLDFMQRFFSLSPFLKLGNISFGYYAVHWPIVISFTCIVVLFFYKYVNVSYVVSAMIAIGISIPVILFAAWIVEKYIYQYLYKAVKFILRKLVEK